MKNAYILFGTLCLVAALPAYSYEEGEVASGGTITGVVSFEGNAPPPRELPNTGCPNHKILSEDLVVTDGKLMNVVITLEKIDKGKPFANDEMTLDQKACTFAPHVLVAFPKKKVKILNSDDLPHNIHTHPDINNAANVSVAPGKSATVTFEDAERVPVKCDMHPAMNAWIVVSETPYGTVSAKDGTFTLDKVPAGKYTLNIWHETLGEQKKEITVNAGETVKVPIKYSK